MGRISNGTVILREGNGQLAFSVPKSVVDEELKDLIGSTWNCEVTTDDFGVVCVTYSFLVPEEGEQELRGMLDSSRPRKFVVIK